MARRCKELRNIHQIKSTIHCLCINLTNIRVLWDHIWLNSCRFLTSVVREMWSDRGDSMFYSLIGRSILMNWAFVQQLGVLIPQRDAGVSGAASHWCRYDMETRFAFLTFCEGNLSITDGFPQQRVTNGKWWNINVVLVMHWNNWRFAVQSMKGGMSKTWQGFNWHMFSYSDSSIAVSISNHDAYTTTRRQQ